MRDKQRPTTEDRATQPMEHPDPEPIVNVQVWKTGASAFWRFIEGFF